MKPIAVGDLVQIVKPIKCCGYSNGLGKVRVVVPDTNRLPTKRCVHCGFTEEHSSATTVLLDGGSYCERNRLKRIPPLDELEGVKTEETLKETE